MFFTELYLSELWNTTTAAKYLSETQQPVDSASLFTYAKVKKETATDQNRITFSPCPIRTKVYIVIEPQQNGRIFPPFETKKHNHRVIGEPYRRRETACKCSVPSTSAELRPPHIATVAGARTYTVRSTAATVTGNPWRHGLVREYSAPESVLEDISQTSSPQPNVPSMVGSCRNIRTANIFLLSGNDHHWSVVNLLMLHIKVGW